MSSYSATCTWKFYYHDHQRFSFRQASRLWSALVKLFILLLNLLLEKQLGNKMVYDVVCLLLLNQTVSILKSSTLLNDQKRKTCKQILYLE